MSDLISLWFDGWENMRIVLKPCPFCGGASYMNQIGNLGYHKKVYIIAGCKPCRFEMKNGSLGSVDFPFLVNATIKQWNARVKEIV